MVLTKPAANAASMNEASKKLFISQPSLSSTIKDLEEEIGVELEAVLESDDIKTFIEGKYDGAVIPFEP